MVDVDKTTILLVTFVVMLVPFPLTSVGTVDGPAILWQLGLALLIVGGVVPPVTRYVFGEDDEDDEAAADRDDADEGEPRDDAEDVETE